MIATLRGKLAEKSLDSVVVDVGGVGYWVQMSMQALSQLPTEGNDVRLRCYTHVREDALSLFGFVDSAEKEAFESLIGVSGVGPKLALTILSGLPVAELIRAVAEGNHPRLQAIPGVGKKTAERLVVELRDRFSKLNLLQSAAGAEPGTPTQGRQDIVEALVALGYRRNQAERAVAQVAEEKGDISDAESLLKLALAAMAEL